MYNKNDYRFYLENRLSQSDDFLAHYGIKGMKWHKHTKGIPDKLAKVRDLLDKKNSVPGEQSTAISGRQYAYEKKLNAKESVHDDQQRGRKRTAQETVKRDQMRGRARTMLAKKRAGSSPEYKTESAYNSKKNSFNKPKRKRFTLKPTNQSVEVISFKDQRTGVDYKKKRK